VWEWCLEWYRYAGYGYAKEVKDPQGPQSGSHRVLRGGSWNYDARRCRSAVRGSSSPDRRDYFIGFRLALVPVQ
ncbi:MAG: SUMF1/EgtB/PvdO family nonheme iron enzyme, partial [Lentisphaeria bacterium]|nr:SUMF1/EgtB/PvdO family nonheme iron enzyme [Lentisphaeria bacterium]